MLADLPTSRATFVEALSAALARGECPSPAAELGPLARLAVEAVAREHPDATVGQISAAYEAFGRESA